MPNSAPVYRFVFKRLIDILLSASAILFFSPLMVLVCLLVYKCDKGPPFFRQERIGLGLQRFRLIKFRTMTVENRACHGAFEAGSTRRVTPIGRLLRAAKLDELPELFNILNGEMSVVGPRPEVKPYVDLYSGEFAIILAARPGLSDYASIKYRHEEELLAGQSDPEAHYRNVVLPDKLKLARRYVRNVSFKNDVGIIIETIKAIGAGRL